MLVHVAPHFSRLQVQRLIAQPGLAPLWLKPSTSHQKASGLDSTLSQKSRGSGATRIVPHPIWRKSVNSHSASGVYHAVTSHLVPSVSSISR